MITRIERNLIMRVQKHLRDAAEAEMGAYLSSGEEIVAAKHRHDRLLRDERDLGRLRRRLQQEAPGGPQDLSTA